MLQFANDNAVARERRIVRSGCMVAKVTWNEWLFRFRQGKSTVDDDCGDDDAADNVDAVELGRVLGLPPVETVVDGCGGRRV